MLSKRPSQRKSLKWFLKKNKRIKLIAKTPKKIMTKKPIRKKIKLLKNKLSQNKLRSIRPPLLKIQKLLKIKKIKKNPLKLLLLTMDSFWLSKKRRRSKKNDNII